MPIKYCQILGTYFSLRLGTCLHINMKVCFAGVPIILNNNSSICTTKRSTCVHILLSTVCRLRCRRSFLFVVVIDVVVVLMRSEWNLENIIYFI